jgi:hypothetical protein
MVPITTPIVLPTPPSPPPLPHYPFLDWFRTLLNEFKKMFPHFPF